MREDRIAQLSQRFKSHAVGRKPSADRNRERRSFFLDGDLVARLDKTHKDLNHTIYPQTVTKAVFLESLLEFGLDHLEEVKVTLTASSSSEPSQE